MAKVHSTGNQRQFQNLVGRRFRYLTVLSREPSRITPSGGRVTRWLCICDCGISATADAQKLIRGLMVSCGCYRRTRRSVNYKDGRSKTTEYHIFNGMKARCFNTRSPAYHNYGGRGIIICPQWLGPNGFQQFLDDMGHRPSKKHTIERINNDGSYTPQNCVWTTRNDQSNNRRSNHRLTHEGHTLTVMQWSRISGIHEANIRRRLVLGWSIARAIWEPLHKFSP